MSVELFLKVSLMLLVLVSHDVQNGISYDFDFVRWPLHFEFPSYTSVCTSINYVFMHTQKQNKKTTTKNRMHTLKKKFLATTGLASYEVENPCFLIDWSCHLPFNEDTLREGEWVCQQLAQSQLL